MKKIIGFFIAGILMTSATFAFGISAGGNVLAGGNIEVLKDSNKMQGEGAIYGAGLYVNTNIYNGLGVQVEANCVSNCTGTGNNVSLVDIPLMAWYNLTIANKVVMGAGTGLNVCCITNEFMNETDALSKWKAGLAAGANVKFYFTKHLGVCVGANGVFEFSNRATEDVINKALKEAHQGKEQGITNFFAKTRNAVYGYAGLEFKFI